MDEYGKWINTGEQLPNEGEYVIGYFRNETYPMKYGESVFKFCECDGYDGGIAEIIEVTHWMPLPEQPE